jgi:hypothetical protein
MLVTISRLDKLASASQVFSWLGMMEGTTSSYTAMILHSELPQPKDSKDGDEDGDDNAGLAHGPKSLSSIELAHTPGLFFHCHFSTVVLTHIPLRMGLST